MNKLLALVALLGLTFGGVAYATEVDEDTYWVLDTPASGDYNWMMDASTYDFHMIQNGASVLEIDADGETIRMANDITLIDDTASEFKIADTTTSEDITFTFSANACTVGSDTGVTDVAFGSLDLQSDAFEFTTNLEVLDSPTNGEICLNGAGGTNNEDICFDLETTANAVALNSNTGTVLLDFAGIDVDLGGGVDAIRLTDTASSIFIPENDSTSLDVGTTGITDGLRFNTTNNAEFMYMKFGLANEPVEIAAAVTLDTNDCGKPLFVTADADADVITLPALASTALGCIYTFIYVGADGGALIDISPNASDGIEGGCTVAAAVDYASGTDDADFGLTKATGLTGDTLTITAGNADDWYITACTGIWTNN